MGHVISRYFMKWFRDQAILSWRSRSQMWLSISGNDFLHPLVGPYECLEKCEASKVHVGSMASGLHQPYQPC